MSVRVVGRLRPCRGGVERPDRAEKLLKVGIAPVPADVEPAELAAWTSLARVILNLHEAVTRN